MSEPILRRFSVNHQKDGQFSVEAIFADNADLESAQDCLWFEFSVETDGNQPLPKFYRAALDRAKTVIGDEIRRLQQAEGRSDHQD